MSIEVTKTNVARITEPLTVHELLERAPEGSVDHVAPGLVRAAPGWVFYGGELLRSLPMKNDDGSVFPVAFDSGDLWYRPVIVHEQSSPIETLYVRFLWGTAADGRVDPEFGYPDSFSRVNFDYLLPVRCARSQFVATTPTGIIVQNITDEFQRSAGPHILLMIESAPVNDPANGPR